MLLSTLSTSRISRFPKSAVGRAFNARNLFSGATPRIRGPQIETVQEKDVTISNERDELPITFADISRAHVAIRSGIKRTTCEKSYFLSELIGSNGKLLRINYYNMSVVA